MIEPIILAVDLGTSGMKVALITISGKVLDWETEPVRLLITPDGGAEQSQDEWWQAFLSATGRLLRREQDVDPGIEGASIGKVLRFVHLTGGMPSMTGKDPAGHMLFIRPKSMNRALYDKRFGLFTMIYEQMKAVYQKMNGLA